MICTAIAVLSVGLPAAGQTLSPPLPHVLPSSAPGVGVGTGARVEGALGLVEAVAATVSRHPEVARALAEVARGRAEVGVARGAWLPQVSYQANLGPNMFGSERDTGLNDNMAGPGLVLNQLLWDFGRTRGQVRAAAATERQRGHELDAVMDMLAERAATTFLEVKRFEELAAATDRQLASLTRLSELIRLRADAGISGRSDLMLSEVRLESARGESIQARSSLSAAKAALANLAGMTAQRYADAMPVVQAFPALTGGEPDYAELPAVAAASEAEQAAQARVGQARAERQPRLGVQLGYSRNNYSYATRDNAFTGMLTVTGDLFRGGRSELIQAAQQERLAAEASRESAILDIQGRLATAREELDGANQRVQAHALQQRNAVATRDIFLEEYKLGQRSLPDLLSAELEIHRADTARIGAQYDALRARVQVEAAQGTLRPSLGIVAGLQEAKR